MCYLVKGFLLGMFLTGFFLLRIQQDCINKWKRLAQKNIGLFLLMDQWVKVKQEGKKIEAYFIKNNYKRIAIYGMGSVGLRLVKELKDTEIEIAYGIDQNSANIYSDIKLVTMGEELSDVDAVIVTVAGGFDAISDKLSERMKCPIVAIEDIINEV